MRRRLVVAPLLKSAPVAAALALSTAAHAASVQTVFSAENALYGAGYQVGQADGWIDDSLRAAIRQYQSDRSGLNTTGELDAATLEALGISANASQLFGGNAVASRAEALAELGLTEDRYQRASFTVAAASAPKPEAAPKAQPKPDPEPVVVVEAAPEPDPEPVVEPETVVKAEPAAPQPESEKEKVATTEKAETPKPQVAEVESTQAIEPSIVTEEPEPTSEPVQVTSSYEFNDSPPPITVAKKTSVEESQEGGESGKNDVEAMLPQEPTAAGVASDSAPAQNAASGESKGNVLTRVFNFLFGWMV